MKLRFSSRIKYGSGTLTVIREEGDPRATSESHFLYLVKKQLNAQGFDLIKKLMSKDGHLVSDDQHYLRSRSRNENPGLMIYSRSWAICSRHLPYNRYDWVVLAVEPQNLEEVLP